MKKKYTTNQHDAVPDQGQMWFCYDPNGQLTIQECYSDKIKLFLLCKKINGHQHSKYTFTQKLQEHSHIQINAFFKANKSYMKTLLIYFLICGFS